MFGIFKKKKAAISIKKDEAEYTDVDGFNNPTWHPIGEGNPFDKRILDIRCVT